jgi:hypothetical protein
MQEVEDYERLSEMDKMYLIEAKLQMEEEWQRWEEEQEKRHLLPAIVELVTIKVKQE